MVLPLSRGVRVMQLCLVFPAEEGGKVLIAVARQKVLIPGHGIRGLNHRKNDVSIPGEEKIEILRKVFGLGRCSQRRQDQA